jgi:hypothetical protein
MSQQVIVDRELKFRNPLNGNVAGIVIPKLKMIDYGFEGTSTLYGWSSTTGANGCTLATAAVDGGAMTMTMGGADNDCGELYHTAQYSAAYNCGMLAKVKISQITQVSVCIGFVDAYENTNDHTAMEISGTALRNCSNTADFAGVIFDTDATTDVWYCGASNNGTEGTPVALRGSLAPTANTFFYAAVQTDTAGNCTFYYGNKIDALEPVGYLPAAIAYASTNLLAPYIGFIARETTAEVCTVSRVIVWQDN